KNFSFLMDEQGCWRLSPAYDMTYIFNSGGFLPETQHCLMIRGKYSSVTLEDVKKLAVENGIRKAESIIRKVVVAVLEFRSIAEHNGVLEQWISAVENTLFQNLEAWGLEKASNVPEYTDTLGRCIENARIEMQFKGNYHLLATINGNERKYVIRKKTSEYEEISRIGIKKLSEGYVKELVSKFFRDN
ncbi:MAG: serine/threonine protein kinase HipA, partial [Bacteroidetes bacterium]|nr:serine/threonine protein kinase HipA [Bacteroidota bacterium]